MNSGAISNELLEKELKNNEFYYLYKDFLKVQNEK